MVLGLSFFLLFGHPFQTLPTPLQNSLTGFAPQEPHITEAPDLFFDSLGTRQGKTQRQGFFSAGDVLCEVLIEQTQTWRGNLGLDIADFVLHILPPAAGN